MDRKKIFIADDDNDFRNILSRIFERTYEVRSFPDGEDLYAALSGQCPDLVITDLQMLRLNGLDLTISVKSKFPNIPVVMVSAADPPADNPADVFFSKPFNIQVFREEVEKLINKSCS